MTKVPHNHPAADDLRFPTDLAVTVLPIYRHRADGTAGRALNLAFNGARIHGASQIEISIDGQLGEVVDVAASRAGLAELALTLPPKVGVNEAVQVTLTLRCGDRVLHQTVTVPPQRQWTVYLYPHSHVDIGYTAPQATVEFIHKRNIEEGINLAAATQDYPPGARYRWNPEVTWPLERLWQTATPAQRERLDKAIRDGHLCVDAGYVHLNTSICGDEELFQVLAFSRTIQQRTGVALDTFQQMDIPGLSWGLVPVMANQGVRYIMAWPNSDRSGHAHGGLDQQPVWWMGPDGQSKVLFLQPGLYGNSGSLQGKGRSTGRPWFGQRDVRKIPPVIKTGSADVDFTKILAEMAAANYPYDFCVLSWCLWDNCPLDADIPDAVKAWNEHYAYPHIVIAGGHEIMETIATRYGDNLPVVRGDFTEYWTDGLGTAARLTAMNRNAKERLVQAETLWSMLSPDHAAPRDQFDEAWRYIALGSEHTFCAENPAEPFFQDAIWKVKQGYFREAEDRTQNLFDDALAPTTDKSDGALGPAEGPAAGGVAVFNTHSWEHGGLVTLSRAESTRGDRVTDEQGRDVPAQRLSTGELVFLAADVPAFGSRHYRVAAGTCPLAEGCTLRGTTLENGQLRVVLDPVTGNITELVNRATGRNFADAAVNGGLNAFRWIAANCDDDKAQADTDVTLATIEAGPLVVELLVSSLAAGCRSVTRSVRLTQGQPWVEITNVVDKLPLVEKDGIHFGFGFAIPQGHTRVDIPWAVMEVEKDQWPQANRNWLAMQRWLDISNDQEGVTWCSLDAPLFEYGKMTANIALSWGPQGPWLRTLEPSSTIYSWVMNNHWHTNFPLTQDGPVTFRYRIRPHGVYDAAAANRFGLEQAQPLAHVTANHDPQVTPRVSLDNDRVCVTIIKSLGDGKATLLRLRSLSDKPETATLTWPGGRPKSMHYCHAEATGRTLIGGNQVVVLPYGLITLHLEY